MYTHQKGNVNPASYGEGLIVVRRVGRGGGGIEKAKSFRRSVKSVPGKKGGGGGGAATEGRGFRVPLNPKP